MSNFDTVVKQLVKFCRNFCKNIFISVTEILTKFYKNFVHPKWNIIAMCWLLENLRPWKNTQLLEYSIKYIFRNTKVPTKFIIREVEKMVFLAIFQPSLPHCPTMYHLIMSHNFTYNIQVYCEHNSSQIFTIGYNFQWK